MHGIYCVCYTICLHTIQYCAGARVVLLFSAQRRVAVPVLDGVLFVRAPCHWPMGYGWCWRVRKMRFCCDVCTHTHTHERRLLAQMRRETLILYSIYIHAHMCRSETNSAQKHERCTHKPHHANACTRTQWRPHHRARVSHATRVREGDELKKDTPNRESESETERHGLRWVMVSDVASARAAGLRQNGINLGINLCYAHSYTYVHSLSRTTIFK